MDRGLLLIFLVLVAFHSLDPCHASKRIKRNPEGSVAVHGKVVQEEKGNQKHARHNFLPVQSGFKHVNATEPKEMSENVKEMMSRFGNYDLGNETFLPDEKNASDDSAAGTNKEWAKELPKDSKGGNSSMEATKALSQNGGLKMESFKFGAHCRFPKAKHGIDRFPSRRKEQLTDSKRKKHRHGRVFKDEKEFSKDNEKMASIASLFKFANTLFSKMSGVDGSEPIRIRERVTVIKPGYFKDIHEGDGSYSESHKSLLHRDFPGSDGAGGTLSYVQPVFIRPLLTLNEPPLDLMGLEDKHPELIEMAEGCPVHGIQSRDIGSYVKALKEVNEAASGFGQCQFIETEDLGSAAGTEDNEGMMKVCTCHLIKKNKANRHVLK